MVESQSVYMHYTLHVGKLKIKIKIFLSVLAHLSFANIAPDFLIKRRKISLGNLISVGLSHEPNTLLHPG